MCQVEGNHNNMARTQQRTYSKNYTEQDVTTMCAQIIEGLGVLDYFRDITNLVLHVF